jgi:hypothetical protein
MHKLRVCYNSITSNNSIKILNLAYCDNIAIVHKLQSQIQAIKILHRGAKIKFWQFLILDRLQTASFKKSSLFLSHWHILQVNLTGAMEGLRVGMEKFLSLVRKSEHCLHRIHCTLISFIVIQSVCWKPSRKKDYLEALGINGKCKTKRYGPYPRREFI